MTNFLLQIYKWYNINKRDLPWRQTKDPYKIWISEIILQQTQVKQGIEYYSEFISRFPTISVLAKSSEDEVLKAWQGFGYYSRARNLHFSAKKILEKYEGKFPDNFKDIRELKGIGDYTASAIASIAFNRPFAAVDGNVSRFISRYYEIKTPIDSAKGKNEIRTIADEIVDQSNPGLHNEALMELGALVCTPVSPKCPGCPVKKTCLAFNNHSINLIPAKKRRQSPRERFFYYFLVGENDKILMQQRTTADIWKNLYELPLIETNEIKSSTEILLSEEFKVLFGGTEFQLYKITGPIVHHLSHQKLNTYFLSLNFSSEGQSDWRGLKVNRKEIHKFAIPKLIENFLSASGII